MYAIIESGGKQHKVVEGEILRLEKLEATAGDSVSFDKVLLVSNDGGLSVGSPYVEASVTAEVLEQGRHKKIRIIKFKRRKHYDKQQGHRQYYTEVKITGISMGASKAAPKKKAAEKKAEPVKQADAPKKEAPKKVAEPKAAAKTDDLSQISGVGKVMVGKLNDAGITSLKQIAEMTVEDIVALDEKLSFKGRIERDNWVQQAKDLLGE